VSKHIYTWRDLFFWPYTYVLWSPDCPRVFKVGYSGDYKERGASVGADISRHLGHDVKFYRLPFRTPWAYGAEKGVQAILDRRKLRTERFKGTSGHTEWFKCTGWVWPPLLFLILYAFGHPKAASFTGVLFALGFFFPVDVVLSLALLWLVQILFALASVCFLIWALVQFAF